MFHVAKVVLFSNIYKFSALFETFHSLLLLPPTKLRVSIKKTGSHLEEPDFFIVINLKITIEH